MGAADSKEIKTRERGKNSEKEGNLGLTFKRTALVGIGPQCILWKKETFIKIW